MAEPGGSNKQFEKSLMNEKLLSVSIVSYNTSALTLDAVRSSVEDIERSEILDKKSEIIIVDNNSSDNSVATLKKYKESCSTPIHIIENADNPGFAKANNQAISVSVGKYVLLLNSDTYVQPGSLEKLVTSFENTKDDSTADLASHHGEIDHLGILAACLLNVDGTYQHQGGSYPTLFSLLNHLLFLDDLPLLGKFLPSTQHDETKTVSQKTDLSLLPRGWVAGTAMMLRKALLDEIGVLDEKIFMYGEDMELCIRAQDHHWDVAQHPTAYITHLKSASSSSSNAIKGEFKGYIYIWSKHKPLWQLPLVKLIIRVGIVLRVLLFDTMGQKEKAVIYKQAWNYLD